MEGTPNFWMTSAGEDLGDMLRPRACRVRGHLRHWAHRECLLVHVDPPVMGQPYGLGGQDIDELVLSPRHRGAVLEPPSEWPLYVFVLRSLDKDVVRDLAISSPEQIEIISWAMLFRTEDEATAEYLRCAEK